MQISKKTAILFTALGLIAGTAGTVAYQTRAANTLGDTNSQNQNMGRRQGNPPAAAGQVTAISGSTITVTDQRSGIVYTVDASSAKLEKIAQGSSQGQSPAKTAINISDIAVNDHVMVQGTVSGTNIVATNIVDGAGMGMKPGRSFKNNGARGTGGTVTAISGNSITLTGQGGQTYTIDASNAAVKKVVDSTVSNIAVGDKLMVEGTVSGNNVAATQIVNGAMGPKFDR